MPPSLRASLSSPFPFDHLQAFPEYAPRAESAAAPQGAWHGGLNVGSVDLIAMVISDSGLESSKAEWWNASALQCVLIGLQPRGGWQILQRAVQWGHDSISGVFGVDCPKQAVYAYFACSIRNRLELWDSPSWSSPTTGSSTWEHVGASHARRPTKLLDGSRGGQGFICSLLQPQENTHYTIEEQARMQLLSVMLVACGLMDPKYHREWRSVMREDFEIGDRLGVVFRPLLLGLIIANVLAVGLAIFALDSIFRRNVFGTSVAYFVKLCSLLAWAVGATSLLMMGGNPRVVLKDTVKIPAHIEARLLLLDSENDGENGQTGGGGDSGNNGRDDDDGHNGGDGDNGDKDDGGNQKDVGDSGGVGDHKIRIEFGSLHGSNYTPDGGFSTLPLHIVREVVGCDIEFRRPLSWKIGVAWSGVMLLLSVALQIVGAQVTNLKAEIMALMFLLVTALFRGYGMSAPEEWMIPSWKVRPGAEYGAALQGQVVSRDGI
jgi:hypothetical protein